MIPLSPRMSTLLVHAALALQGAPKTGAARMEAETRMSDVLLAINGAPFMWCGPLSPDKPAYPLPETDSVVLRARERLGLTVEPMAATVWDERGNQVDSFEGDADAVIPEALRFLYLQACDPDGGEPTRGRVEFHPLDALPDA